jgi:hypothetical protein
MAATGTWKKTAVAVLLLPRIIKVQWLQNQFLPEYVLTVEQLLQQLHQVLLLLVLETAKAQNGVWFPLHKAAYSTTTKGKKAFLKDAQFLLLWAVILNLLNPEKTYKL